MTRWNRVVVVVAGWLVAGCLESDTTQCANGRTCPGGTVCDTIHDGCVERDQLTACNGLAELAPCPVKATDDGICDQGVCLAKRCGDGHRTDNEACDGADIPPDANCNKIGFYESGVPACNDACGFDTNPETTVCTGFCGDHVVTPGVEVCDGDSGILASCVDFGFGTGSLGCSTCAADTRTCVAFDWSVDGTPADAIDVHGTAADDVWALLQDPTLHNSLVHFDGTVWSPVDLSGCNLVGGSTDMLSSIWSPARGVVFAAGYTVIRVANGVCTKVPVPGGPFTYVTRLWASGATDAWVAESDTVWQFDGTTWTSRLVGVGGSPDEGFPDAIWGSGPSDVYVSISEPDGDRHITHYTGSPTWTTPVNTGIAKPSTIWGTSASDIYVAGRGNAQIAHYNGVSWSAFRSAPPLIGTNPYTGIDRGVTAPDGRVYVVGAGGSRSYMFVYDGLGWIQLDAPPGYLPALWATSGGIVFTTSPGGGKVAQFSGSGRIDTPIGTVPGAVELVASASDDAYCIVGFSQVAHWNGATWTVEPAVKNAYGVALSPTGTPMAVASTNLPASGDNGLWVRAPNGTWTNNPNGAGSRVWALADDDVWILDAGAITVRHWVSASTATSLPFNTGVFGKDIWASSDSDVYVVGYVSATHEPAILHHDGSAWTMQTPPAGIGHVDFVWGRSATDVYAVSELGALIHTTGNGVWTQVATPAGARVSDVWGAPDDLVIATNNGLWRFNGIQWDPIDLGSPVNATRVTAVGNVIDVIDGLGAFHQIVRLEPWPMPMPMP